MTTIDITNAQLTELLAPAKAGNDVLLTKGDALVARLTTVAPAFQRVANLHPGAFWFGEAK